jgi:hypothetical protein
MLYGWDVSTSIVGMSEFDDDGKFQFGTFLDLRKIEGLNEKADAARVFVQDHVCHTDTNTHFIEERLGNFAAGRSMLQVLMKLAAFNAVFGYIVHVGDSTGSIRHVHPSTWKSIMRAEGLLIPKGSDDKKRLTLEFVRSRESNFVVDLNRAGKPQPWMFDIADSYCIGRSGHKLLCKERESSSPSEGPLTSRVTKRERR